MSNLHVVEPHEFELDGLETAVGNALQNMEAELQPPLPPAVQPESASEPRPLQADILAHTVAVNRHFLARLEHDMARLRTNHLMLESDLQKRLDEHNREAAAAEKELLSLIARNKAAMAAVLDERALLIRGTNILLDTIDPKAKIENDD